MATKHGKTGKTDQTFNVSLNADNLNKFQSQGLKEYAEKIRNFKIRIVKVKLKNGKTETLLTNLPNKIATPKELKQLYGDRWKIETNYDRLKNKLHIEKFIGKKKIIIEQDFYSHICLFNILIALFGNQNNN
ncbi:transposase [Methanobrevibacter sp.]|uniref:transposase n=1 Tax=Methanobrevibacter sp. TaxID=66852 RepID=UPI00386B9170